MNFKKKLTNFSIKKSIHDRVMALGVSGKRDQTKVKYVRANILPEFWGVTLDNFVGNKPSVKLVKKYCGRIKEVYNRGIGFLLTGPNGVGKTSLQCIILKAAINAGYSAFYITLPEIFHYIKLGFDDPNLLLELYDILQTTDFLAVGELGKDYHREGSAMFMRAEFDMIFRHRRSMNLPTSLDTNMELSEVFDTYGESLISLFRGCLKEIKMTGKDFRHEVQRRDVDAFFEGTQKHLG